MFAEGLLESARISGSDSRRRWATALSVFIQSGFVALLIIIPMLATDRLQLRSRAATVYLDPTPLPPPAVAHTVSGGGGPGSGSYTFNPHPIGVIPTLENDR